MPLSLWKKTGRDYLLREGWKQGIIDSILTKAGE